MQDALRIPQGLYTIHLDSRLASSFISFLSFLILFSPSN
jgi:hypothetical protein